MFSGEHRAMTRPAFTIDEQDLERALLRRSVGSLSDSRNSCRDCGRTPLIGETLYRYAGGDSVCELCRPLRREASVASELVRHSEYGHAVRIHRVDAARPAPG